MVNPVGEAALGISATARRISPALKALNNSEEASMKSPPVPVKIKLPATLFQFCFYTTMFYQSLLDSLCLLASIHIFSNVKFANTSNFNLPSIDRLDFYIDVT